MWSKVWVLGVWFWIGIMATDLGMRWQAVSHVTPNVTATLNDNRQVTGELRYRWDRTRTITTEQGEIHQIDDFKMLEIPVSPTERGLPWRAFLPLVAWISMSALFVMRFAARTQAANRR